MSDELRLPDDLAACEARLAAQPLPGARIDRDQLLYRAGWAACESRLAALTPHPSKGRARGGISSPRSIAAWSLTSAAVAASLAVVITLQWQPAGVRDMAANSSDARRALAAAPANPVDVSHVEIVDADSSSARTGQIDVGIFAQRSQALKSIWMEPTEAVALASEGETQAAKTARELMQELLPAESVRPAKIWPWGHSLLGGSI